MMALKLSVNTAFLVRILFFSIVLCVTSLSYSREGNSSDGIVFDPPIRISETLKRYTKVKNVAFDPEVIQMMTTEYGQFYMTYCGEYADVTRVGICKELAGKISTGSDPLYSSIEEFLEPFYREGRSREQETLFSILARKVGSSSKRAGWASRQSYSFFYLEVNKLPEKFLLAVSSDKGLIKQGPGVSSVLLARIQKSIYVFHGDQQVELSAGEASGFKDRITIDSSPIDTVHDYSITVDAESYCLESNVNDVQPYNWGRSLVVGSTSGDYSPKAEEYASFTGLKVSILDETGACGLDCETALALSIVKSFATWLSGCARCSESSMTVLKIEDSVFVDSRILEAISNSSFDSLPQKATQQAVYTGLTSATKYVALPKKKYWKSGFCDAIPRSSAKIFKDIQSLTCSDDIETPNTILSANLVLRKGHLSCGSQNDVLGCANSNGDVELATAKWRFAKRIPDKIGSVFVGHRSGKTLELDRVIYHEVGHWLGVPHMDKERKGNSKDRRQNIMAPRYALGGSCFSRGNLNAINNAADSNWEKRLGAMTCSGLLPPLEDE